MSAERTPPPGCVLEPALRGLLQLWQPEQGYRYSVDSFLLADFALSGGAAGAGPLIDLGAGCGVVGLTLAARLPGARVRLVELQPRLAELCRCNVAQNGLGGRVDVIEADLRALQPVLGGGGAELVVSNPPFQPAASGRASPDPERAVANTELEVTLTGLVASAARLLQPRGALAVIYPAERTGELLMALGEHGLRPVRLRPVYPRRDREARRVLVQARKGVRDPLRVEPPLTLHGEGDAYTAEAARILGE